MEQSSKSNGDKVTIHRVHLMITTNKLNAYYMELKCRETNKRYKNVGVLGIKTIPKESLNIPKVSGHFAATSVVVYSLNKETAISAAKQAMEKEIHRMHTDISKVYLLWSDKSDDLENNVEIYTYGN